MVTRPMPAAQIWQHDLIQRLPANTAVHCLPLIDIAPFNDPTSNAQLQQLCNHTAQLHAIAFVSRFAVEHFFAQAHLSPNTLNQLGIRAWAVGQGTRDALLHTGVAAQYIDTPPAHAQQFDSDILWQQVAPQFSQPHTQAKSVLLVRGIDAAHQLQASKKNRLEHILHTHHIAHTSVYVYARQCPVWNAQQQAAVMQRLQQRNIWLLSSSIAVVHLAQLLPQISSAQWRTQHAIATHTRIAETAAKLGFAHIHSTRPVLDDVVQCIYACQTST